MVEKKGTQRNIQSLERAVSILDYLVDKPQGERLMVISRELGLNKSTAFGLISTLEDLGLLHQSSQTGKYLLGLKLLDYSGTIKDSLRLPDLANSIMERLANRFEENVHLASLEGNSVLYLGTVTTSKTMQVLAKVGKRAPFYSTSLGKVLVSFLPDGELEYLLDTTEMIPRTKNTICDKEQFKREVEKIRRNGYASERDEGEVGISCFAAPIHNSSGEVVAAISIAQPTSRLDERDPDEIVKCLLEAAREISLRCGDFDLY